MRCGIRRVFESALFIDPRCTIVETRLTSDALTASGFFVYVDLFTLDFGRLVRYNL